MQYNAHIIDWLRHQLTKLTVLAVPVIFETSNLRVYDRPSAMENAWLLPDADNWA